jgi:Glycosyl hydrolase family 48/Cellulose binding domain/Bacterial Ig domain
MRISIRRSRLRVYACWLSCAALIAGMSIAGTGVAAATAAQPAVPAASAAGQANAAPAATTPACQVAYSVNDWGTGFTATITITNNGPAITSWTLAYAYSGNQKLANGWSGNWTESGENVTVTNAAWNGSLATGASTQIGANFNYSGTNTAPTAFTVNGTPCNGNGGGTCTAPSVSISSPTAGEIFTPGSNITLQATATAGTGCTVKSVSFYDSTSATTNNLVGTSTASPYSVQWASVPAGSYSLTAVVTDSAGQTTTSSPVAITVEAASIVANPTSLTVQQGKTGTFGLALSSAPSASVTVTVTQSGDSDLSASPTTLTFTTSNWNVPQNVTVTAGTNSADVGANGTFTAAATGYGSATVTVTESAVSSGYDTWFTNLYNIIKNPTNGYFSPKGIPYHSVETLIVEAPDYGHETTSETYSYWLWLEADYGRVTGDWTGFNNAWSNMETYMIPNDANQPGQCTYNASSPAQYGPEEPLPSDYPVSLNSSVPVGSDPLFSELRSTYGNCDMYQPMWIMDTDNRYGFGQQEDGTSTPSWINSYQRGPMESVWDTIPQPDWDAIKSGYGGPNGFLDLFNNGGGSFAAQYKYTDAPDADARLVQAAYWADTYAKAQGKTSSVSATLAKAAKLGDFLRYSMFDKYFKQISANCSQVGSAACPAGTSKANEDTYLLSWFDAWGGSTGGAWSWRISGTTIHEGYQNPLAAFALSTDTNLIPLSPSAKGDWTTSLTTQLNMYSWLQSAEGAIAGGFENNWGGNYGDVSKPPSGDPTFDGMYYDPQPEYHNPPSNQWFGYQTWPMERLAEYYYVTGNAQAKAILAKWVSWAESVTTVTPSTGTLLLPGKLAWSGQPSESWTTGTSNSSIPPANTGLHVSVTGTPGTDIGVASSLAKVYEYYAAKSGDTTAETAAQNIIDVIHKYYADSLGFSAPETRTDYKNFTTPYDNTNVEGVFIPANWTGTYPGGVKLSSSTNTFLSIRPWYTSDPNWSKVQTYLNGGAAPVFNYHRFWAEVDVATAFDAFAYLFPNVQPPSGF